MKRIVPLLLTLALLLTGCTAPAGEGGSSVCDKLKIVL